MRIAEFRWIPVAILAGVIWLLPLPGEQQKTSRADVALEAAAKKETVDGDLKAAIGLYQGIVSQFATTDRAAAAMALVRMGQCYEKLGSTEARRAYERAVREFADQNEAAAAARARLLALGGGRPSVTYRQVWTGPKVDFEGTVSPDGRYLSYVDWETGDLAIHDFAANSDRRLTNTGTWPQEFAVDPTISRDGRQVAYAWFNAKQRYEVRIVSLQTSGFPQPRRLFESEDVVGISPCDWSPDGRWLAVEWRESRSPTVRNIGLLSTQDGSLRVLKSGLLQQSTRVFFSPDAKFLGIDAVVGSNSDRHVLILAADGTAEAEAVADPGQNLMMGWSPDGKRLLFASDRRGSLDLWALPVGDGNPKGVPELIRPDIPPRSLGITSSGAMYLGARLGDWDINIASVDFATGKLLSPPARPVQTFIGSNWWPDWSPDGKKLAYVSSRNGASVGSVLAIHSLETGQVRELRPDLRMLNLPRWSPDGDWLACQGTDNSGRQGIYRINVESGQAIPIALSTSAQRFGSPEWSQDGKRITYIAELPSTQQGLLLERDLLSGKERELYRSNSRDIWAVRLSPDGRSIVVRKSDSPGLTAVRIIPTTGGDGRELMRVSSPDSLLPLAWLPNGDGVILITISGDGDRRRLWLAPASGGQPRKLDIDASGFAAGPFSVHPDGRQIAYMAGKMNNEVMVLENFLPAVKTNRN